MGLIGRVRARIGLWYEGRYVGHDNLPESNSFIVGGYYDRHWTAVRLRKAVEFYQRNWERIFWFAAGLVGLVVKSCA